MTIRTTISEKYLAEQRLLHRNPGYGVAAFKFASMIREMIKAYKIKSITDYGAGKLSLKAGLDEIGVQDIDYFPYDPVFPEYGDAKPADLVCCIDVLEHIEPEFVERVMDDIASVTNKIGFFSIATAPAKKTLSDGRNAHLLQKPAAWWLPIISRNFEVLNLWRMGTNILMIVERVSRH